MAVTFTELEKVCQDGSLPIQSAVAGFVFGTDPRTCHVILGYSGTSGISGKHFAIRTDGGQQVVLIDMGSSHGTAVESNGQNKEQKRQWDEWILSGQPGSADRFNTITIWLGELALSVVCPNHQSGSLIYRERLTDFGQTWNVSESKHNEMFALRAWDYRTM